MTPTDLKAAARRVGFKLGHTYNLARGEGEKYLPDPTSGCIGSCEGCLVERAALAELTRLDAYHTERYLNLIETKDAERERVAKEQYLRGRYELILAHRCGCERCVMTGELCTATRSAIAMEMTERERAVREEREACAAIEDELIVDGDGVCNGTVAKFARLIRARGERRDG